MVEEVAADLEDHIKGLAMQIHEPICHYLTHGPGTSQERAHFLGAAICLAVSQFVKQTVHVEKRTHWLDGFRIVMDEYCK